MSDVMNNILGRSQYETPQDAEYSAAPATADSEAEDATATPESVEAEEIEEPSATESLAESADKEPSGDDNDAAAAKGEEENVPEEAAPVTEARPAAGTRGSTTVGDGVVTKIVTRVARGPEGVYSLLDDDVAVEIEGDVATIQVSLVIEFGHAVKALAEQLRTDVIEAVEGFLGLDVAAVDIHIADVHFPDAG
ncbi:Asp23/Gls24 family envelope stress response protein [Amycolatopsis sp. NEAU-NG30]|uniref:Asp23/Gls24 family envelope stress response protein n=1 Tax=Amycolatopsis melonis TaxID=3156488 RepID=A0ABV0LTH1_9PSEU